MRAVSFATLWEQGKKCRVALFRRRLLRHIRLPSRCPNGSFSSYPDKCTSVSRISAHCFELSVTAVQSTFQEVHTAGTVPSKLALWPGSMFSATVLLECDITIPLSGIHGAQKYKSYLYNTRRPSCSCMHTHRCTDCAFCFNTLLGQMLQFRI
jgi:hypothetical protein